MHVLIFVKVQTQEHTVQFKQVSTSIMKIQTYRQLLHHKLSIIVNILIRNDMKKNSSNPHNH
jgi:hypothetical protein